MQIGSGVAQPRTSRSHPFPWQSPDLSTSTFELAEAALNGLVIVLRASCEA